MQLNQKEMRKNAHSYMKKLRDQDTFGGLKEEKKTHKTKEYDHLVKYCVQLTQKNEIKKQNRNR